MKENNYIVDILICMFDLMVLNMLWILSCIPLITFGPATKALHYVIWKIQKREGASPVKLYIREFKKNFMADSISGLISLIFYTVFFINNYIYRRGFMGSDFLYTFLYRAILIFFAIFIIEEIYYFQIRARFEMGVVETRKSAFVLAIKYFGFSLNVLAVNGLIVFAGVFLITYLPVFRVLIALLGIPVMVYLNIWRFEKIWKEYIG